MQIHFVLAASYKGRIGNNIREPIFTHWKCKMIMWIIIGYFKKKRIIDLGR